MSSSFKFISNRYKTSVKLSSKTNLSHSCMKCLKLLCIGCSIWMKSCTESIIPPNLSTIPYRINTISRSWSHNPNRNTSVKSSFYLYCYKHNTTNKCMLKLSKTKRKSYNYLQNHCKILILKLSCCWEKSPNIFRMLSKIYHKKIIRNMKTLLCL